MSSRNKTDVKKLFEFWCEVAPAYSANADRSLRNGISTTTSKTLPIPAGIITESFPENFRDEKTIADIPVFAFPCELHSDAVQSYSFVLTTDDSKWRFGFCRHDPKTDTAIVVITYLPWHDTFLRLLTVLAELRRSDTNEFKTFLTEAYSRGVPELGGNLKLFYNSGQSYFVFERPAQFQLPSIPENHNLNLYYNFVEPKNMIAVFAAMLAERRIIFTSRWLDRLSSCIQAANAFLYPMVWQHIFIPVLPMKLKDYLSAPMPYLIGVPETVLETMMPEELGDVVILNCDLKIFDSPFDDVRDMPNEIVTHLKKQLSQTSEHMGDRVSKIFLGVLVQLIGGYRDAVEFRDNGKTFNRDKFIESRPSHLRPFLTKMMDLQIFQQFIDERLEMLNTGLGFSDEFEMETVRYAEKMKKRSRNLAFLKNVKDKLMFKTNWTNKLKMTNPAVKSAVKSVKEGSRGMKTAYKDLKSKFRDITPPNNPQFRSHLPANSQHDHLDGSSNSTSSSSNGYIIHGNNKAKTNTHHSAPSSPIFSNKSTGIVRSTQPFQYAKPEAISGAVQTFRRAGPNPLAMSNSITHVQSNGYTPAALHANHHNSHLAASPTVSPASSLCSSEMNLSQELQNHPLFKTPIVDRSSLRSLQPNYMDSNNAATMTGSMQSVPSCGSSLEDTTATMATNDLISLDDSHNTSFDLEDFDPLNQNAKPLPPLKSVHRNAAPNMTTNASTKSTTLPTGSTLNSGNSKFTGMKSVQNPLYHYYVPPSVDTLTSTNLKPPNCKPPPLPTSQPPALPLSVPPQTRPAADDDFELLRKYGLDQFTLTTSVTGTTNAAAVVVGTAATQAATTATGMSNWTTFD